MKELIEHIKDELTETRGFFKDDEHYDEDLVVVDWP